MHPEEIVHYIRIVKNEKSVLYPMSLSLRTKRSITYDGD